MQLPRPSRRTLIKAGVWSAPVVVAATATPSFASSGSGLVVAEGNTRIEELESRWMGPVFEGFVIQSSTALEAHELSVTFTVTAPSRGASLLYDPSSGEHVAPPATWSAPETGLHPRSITFTYAGPVLANEPVHLSGLWALVAREERIPLHGFALTVVVSAPGATPVSRTFVAGGLSVDGGLTRIADAPLAAGHVGTLFDGFAIQSTTDLGIGDLTVDLHVNGGSVRYDPGVLHDAPGSQWSAAPLRPPGSVVSSGVVFANSIPVPAHATVRLEGLLALATEADGSPSRYADQFRVIVRAPDKMTVSRSFFIRALQ